MNKAENIKLVIFDMDGLLVDSEKVYRNAWMDAAERINENIPSAVVSSLAGKGISASIQTLLDYGLTQESVDRMREMRESYIHEETVNHRVEIKAFAEELLNALKAHDYLVGLASSSPKKRGIEILQTLNLYKYIDFSIFGNEVKQQKPSPEPYLTILKESRLSKEQAVVIEDSLTGVAAARNAGLSVIQVPDCSIETSKKDETGYAAIIGDDLRIVLEYLGIEN